MTHHKQHNSPPEELAYLGMSNAMVSFTKLSIGALALVTLTSCGTPPVPASKANKHAPATLQQDQHAPAPVQPTPATTANQPVPAPVQPVVRKLGGLDFWGSELPAFAFARAGNNRLSATHFDDVAMSHDGTRFVSSGYHGLVVWDAATGKPLHEIEGHADDNYGDVAFTPDDQRVVALSGKHVVAFDLTSKKIAWRTKVSRNYTSHLALSPKKGAIAVSRCARHGSGRVLLLTSSGRDDTSFSVDKGCPNRPAFSSDGELLAVGSDAKVYVWRISSERRIATIDMKDVSVQSVVFHPNHQSLYVGGYNDVISQVTLDDPRVLRSFGYLKGSVMDMELTPDGRRLIANTNGETRVFDTRTSRLLIRADKTAEGVAVSPDGKFFVSPIRSPAMVARFDLSHGKRLGPADLGRHDREITSVLYAPDGMRLATADDRGTLRIWSAMTGEPLAAHKLDHAGTTRMLAHDGKLLVAATDCHLRIMDWDAKEVAAIERPNKGSCSRVLSLDHFEGRVATLEGEDVFIWDLKKRTVRKTLSMKGRRARALLLTPDGFSVGAENVWVRYNDKDEKKAEVELGIGQGDKILGAARSPDGQWIAVHLRHQIDILARKEGKLVRSLQLRHDQTWDGALGFSPDGAHLIAAHGPYAMIWRTGDWKLLRALDLLPETPKESVRRLRAATLGPQGLGAIAVKNFALLFPTLHAP